MNIFKEPQDFIGQFNENTEIITLKEVLSTTSKIKEKLGKQGYLLDTYLTLFFETINSSLAFELAEYGFRSGFSLHELSSSVRANKEDCKSHILYEKAMQILQSNKSIIEFQEQNTQLNILYLTLVDDYLPMIINDFIKEQKEELLGVLDEIRLQQLYREISHIVGEIDMEQLHLLLKQKFVVSSALASFVQGFTNDLLHRLMTKDIETNKMGFQLLMDMISNVE